MANTLYAAFADPSLAEKAAGALLDHGVRAEDISVVQNESRYNEAGSVAGSTYGVQDNTTSTPATYGTAGNVTTATSGNVNPDDDNDMVDAGDSAVAGTKSVGNRIAEYGDRAAGAVSDAIGADNAAAGYRAAADQRDAIADQHGARSEAEFKDAVDMPGSTASGTFGSNTGQVDTSGTMDSTKAYGQNQIDNRDAMSDSYAASQGANPAYSDQARETNYERAEEVQGYKTGGVDTVGSTAYGTTDMSDVNRPDDVDDDDDTEHAAKQGISTTTAADAGSGAVTGTAIGLGVGAVAALASLLVPGVGLVVGGGALAAALGGMAASAGAGAAAGAVTGYLKDQGMEDHVAAEYETTVSGGGAMLAVHVPSGDVDEAKATEVLSKYGASNIRTYAATGTGPYMG